MSDDHSFSKFEAIKIGWKQDKEGNVLTMRLHFDQDTSMLAMLPLGYNVLLAIAEIKS